MDFPATRALFDLPEGLIYLDGNSLGPLPKSVPDRISRTVAHWGTDLIGAWNDRGWMDWPDRLGDRIAPLVGAAPGTVAVGDTLSIRVYQALAAALEMTPGRRVILSDSGNFPTDLYMAGGLARSLGRGHRVVTPPPEEVADHLSEDVAVLMLTEVDYRTGRRHDMAALTAAAHDHGISVIWDLAHSAGALPIDLGEAEFAAGCTYKYLNAGPGAPAFLYVRPDLADAVSPALPGWLGHAQPFDFTPDYSPAHGAKRLRIGTPPVIQMAALDAALDVWDQVDMAALRRESLRLADRLIEAVGPALRLVTPTDPDARGSQVSFGHPEGYAIIRALAAEGVVGDFRAPDILRFGITPLYTAEADIDLAAETLHRILQERAWDRPENRRRSGVT